uniref:Uncharacterized protein n=1 Tax=Arundo donax TaxID=35708 RepID=A0A0A9BTN7_ARUDO
MVELSSRLAARAARCACPRRPPCRSRPQLSSPASLGRATRPRAPPGQAPRSPRCSRRPPCSPVPPALPPPQSSQRHRRRACRP